MVSVLYVFSEHGCRMVGGQSCFFCLCSLTLKEMSGLAMIDFTNTTNENSSLSWCVALFVTKWLTCIVQRALDANYKNRGLR